MKRTVTASELMARLHADPNWVARADKRAAERQRMDEEFARAEAPLVAELRAAGVPVASVWDLVNTRNPYPQSLSILLNHLQRPYPDPVRDGIARAMAIPEAKIRLVYAR